MAKKGINPAAHMVGLDFVFEFNLLGFNAEALAEEVDKEMPPLVMVLTFRNRVAHLRTIGRQSRGKVVGVGQDLFVDFAGVHTVMRTGGRAFGKGDAGDGIGWS